MTFEHCEEILVQSSNIKSMGYDENFNTLYLRFINGGIYAYYDVLPIEFENFLHAESKGGYFSKNIRPRYIHEKLH